MTTKEDNELVLHKTEAADTLVCSNVVRGFCSDSLGELSNNEKSGLFIPPACTGFSSHGVAIDSRTKTGISSARRSLRFEKQNKTIFCQELTRCSRRVGLKPIINQLGDFLGKLGRILRPEHCLLLKMYARLRNRRLHRNAIGRDVCHEPRHVTCHVRWFPLLTGP